jgi:hypothetical protein
MEQNYRAPLPSLCLNFMQRLEMYSSRTNKKQATDAGRQGGISARKGKTDKNQVRFSGAPRVSTKRASNVAGRSPTTAPLSGTSPVKQSETKGSQAQPRYQVRKQVVEPEGNDALSEITTRTERDRFEAIGDKCNAGKLALEEQSHVPAWVSTGDSEGYSEAQQMLSDPDALVDPSPRPVQIDPRARFNAIVQKSNARKSAMEAHIADITKKAHSANNRQLDSLLVYLNHPARLKVKHLHQAAPPPEKLSVAKTNLDQGTLKLNPSGTEDASVATALLQSYLLDEGSKLIPISQQNVIAQAQLFWFTGVDEKSLPGVLALSTLDLMPEPHKSAFVKVLQHFARVANNSATNRTDARKLAFIYGKMLIADVKISPSEYKARLALAHSVMQCMIELHMADLSASSESQ